MKKKYILAIDQGTSTSRAILFNRQGEAVSQGQKEFKQFYPKPGWVEHDPEEIWNSQQFAIETAMKAGGAQPDDVTAIGITNQRETTVVWDRNSGKPVYPAIVWQDRRTASECDRMREEKLEPIFRDKTGLLLDPYFSGTKLAWILDNVKGVRDAAEKGDLLFGTIDSWLLWKLTNGRVHKTDVTNASRTLMMNIHSGEWDEELLKILNIPIAMLPEIRSCSEILGQVDTQNTLAGIPISGIAGDQQAALFGQACFDPGMVKNTYGTGCFLLMNTGEKAIRSSNNLLTTIAWKIGNKTSYALEGSVFVGGAIIQWLRDELGIIKTAQECDELADSVDGNSGLFIVPALTGLGAPHWDPYARGLAVGFSRGTNKAHFCRAALESIAFQSADLIDCMKRDSEIELKELRVDGGASKSRQLLQFQADLLGSDVIRPTCIETTAMGAAYLAGLAVGFWDNLDDIKENWKVSQVFLPEMEEEAVEKLKAGWNKAVQRSKNWIDR